MATIVMVPQLVQQKLQAFERLEPEFEDCFLFVQDVHGQERFSSFPVTYTHEMNLREHIRAGSS